MRIYMLCYVCIHVMYLCLSSQFFFWVGGSVKVSIEEDGVAGVMG